MSKKTKVRECDCCGFATDCSAYAPNPVDKFNGREDHWFCWLCANSLAGNAYSYPAQHPELTTLRVICFVGNAILAELKGREP